VDPDANGHIRVFRRRTDQDLFRSANEMQLRLFPTREKTGRLEDNFDTEILPRQLCRITLLQHAYLVAADDDVLLVVTDLAIELPMNRIPLEEVSQRVCIG